jgi:serine phosphatase RsbU (regulator of sigma subunit)
VKTNAALYGNIDRKAFVSLLYAILDLERGTLQYARAGHCPVLYLHGDEPNFLKPGGMGLGLDHSPRFVDSIQEESIELRTDDLIILYTDGITEARNEEQEEFGYDRLARIVAQKRRESTHALMHTIIHEVKSFTGGGAAEDDITLLLLRWNGRPAGLPGAAVHPLEMTAH